MTMSNVSIRRRVLASGVLVAFLLTSGFAPGRHAFGQEMVPRSDSGTCINLSPAFAPPLLKGLKIHSEDPFRVDFILDQGDSSDPVDQLKSEIPRLIKYFLASLTIPEKDLWVNLSPYEKDRIVPDAFGVTEMGRDLLIQDYMLKQIAASVIYPESEVGKVFWAKVYAEAQKRYGTTDIPVDTFHKVWIVPEKAVIYESKDSAYVVESRLKVMLETDYLATQGDSVSLNLQGDISKDVQRSVIIPLLEKEVNEGRNFAQLRQVYHSLILAIWFKDKIKESLLGQAYIDQGKVAGVDIEDKASRQKIWARYVEAFKRGSYNYIKEEVDPTTQQLIPRKYFSGGAGLFLTRSVISRRNDRAQLPEKVSRRLRIVATNFRPVDDAAQKPAIQWSEIGNDGAAFEARLAEEARRSGYATDAETKYVLFVGNTVVPRAEGQEGSQYHRIFNQAFKVGGVNIVFLRANTEPSELNQALGLMMRSARVAGFNVTSPHKVEVFNRLRDEEKDDTARMAGAVNCIVKQANGRRRGLTSDGEGWVYWYTQYLHKSLAKKNIVVLGAGGATRSLVMALLKNAPDAKIVLSDREAATAEQLKDAVLAKEQRANIKAVDIRNVNEAIRGADIVINFTGSGKSYDDQEQAIPDIDYSLLKGKEAIDANYRFKYAGPKNEFLKRAEAAGAEIYNGLGFTVGTIPPLFEAFTGKQVNFNDLMAFARSPDGADLQEAASFAQGPTGGIDLARARRGLHSRNAENGVSFKFDPVMIRHLQTAAGLTPVILNIQPMTTTIDDFFRVNSGTHTN